MKKILSSSILRIAVSLSLIVILSYIMRNNYAHIALLLRSININKFSLAVLFFTAAIFLASFRLMFIIRARGIPSAISEAFSLTLIGYFFNNFLPTAIGGDVVKAYYLSKKTNDKIGSYTAIFLDRGIGLLTMVLMAFVVLFFAEARMADSPLRKVIYLATFASALGVVFLTNKKFAKRLASLFSLAKPLTDRLKVAYNAFHEYKNRKFLLAAALGISLLSQLLFFMSLGLLAMSIGSRIPFREIFLRMPIIGIVCLLPSINGLGTREGSTVLLFGPLIGKENAFAISVLWLIILLVTSVLGGIVYALSPQFKVKLKNIQI